MSRHQGRRTRRGIFLVAITAALLTACSTDAPETTPSTTSAEQAPLDPYQSSEIGRTWQQEVVSTIVDVGRSRADVDDDDIIAALTASYAESEWSIRLTGRNLLGWTFDALKDSVSYPDSDLEIRRAVDVFYDRYDIERRSASSGTGLDEIALQAQAHDSTKDREYFDDRPCDGERPWRQVCTPERAQAKYAESLPFAEAAYQQLRFR